MFFLVLAGMVISYLALIEVGKRWFYGTHHARVPARRHRTPGHRVRRRAARFTTHTLRPPGRPVRDEAAPSTSPPDGLHRGQVGDGAQAR